MTQTAKSARVGTKDIRLDYMYKNITRWSYAEAADYSGLGQDWLRQCASRGCFTVYRHGRKVDRQSFVNWHEGRNRIKS